MAGVNAHTASAFLARRNNRRGPCLIDPTGSVPRQRNTRLSRSWDQRVIMSGILRSQTTQNASEKLCMGSLSFNTQIFFRQGYHEVQCEHEIMHGKSLI